MTDLTPITRLARVAVALRSGEMLSTDDALEIAAAIERHLHEGVSLDEALALRSVSGERKPVSQLILAKRNILIRAAAHKHYPGGSINYQSEQLHAALSRFEQASSWRSTCADADCPARFSGTIRADLWAILKIWPKVIGERQLRKILGPE